MIQRCPDCGTENQLPDAALQYGAWRCFSCDAVHVLPGRSLPDAPSEMPIPDAFEPLQTGPSFTPSAHNTPEALERAKAEGAKIGCLVGLFSWLFTGS
jgi:hypothetical protein